MRTTMKCGLALILLAATQPAAWGQTSYTSNSASGAWNTTRWNNSTDGPAYSSTYNENNNVYFASGNYTFSGMGFTTNVGNITLADNVNVTFSSSSSTLATSGNVRTLTVGNGSILNFAAQNFSNGAGTGFIKAGSGTVILAPSSTTFRGGFTLNGGTVIAQNDSALGSGVSNVLTLNGGKLASGSDRIFGTNGGIVVGGNVQFGDTVGLASSTSKMEFSDKINLGAENRTLTRGNGGDVTFSGVISGSGGVTFAATTAGIATGLFDLTNTANTFSGGIEISSGQVRFAANGSLGHSGNDIVIDGGRLATSSGSSDIASTHTIRWGGTSGSALNVVTGAILTYSGVMTNKGSSTGSFIKEGTGTMIIGGASTYSGQTEIRNGILQLTSANDRLPTGTTVTLGTSASTSLGTLDLNGRSQQLAGLKSAAGTNATASNNTVTSSSAATLTLTGSETYVFGSATNANSGVIAGALSLVKAGSGTQILGDSHSYTGTTTINAGTLAVNGSLSSSSAVTVAGGTLGGTGTIGGTITVNPGGTIRGDSETGTGMLALGNATTLVGAANGGGATLATYLDVDDGSIVANSKLSTGTNALNFDVATGKFNILLLNDEGLTAGQSYTITLANGTNFRRNGLAATSFLAADFTLASGSGSWEFLSTSLSVSSSKLELTFVPTTPVPEPASVLTWSVLGLTATVGARKRCGPFRRSGKIPAVTWVQVPPAS